jgi:spore coat polysaccharide biosynthesis predicted glycosyltransferase SpsG
VTAGRIALAFDEGGGAGLGHRRRMEALAAALVALGHDADLAPITDVVEADVAVVDSYRMRADDRSAIKARAVVAVEDLGRDLAVDLLVDPNPDPPAYRLSARALAGPAYALIDPDLAALPWPEPSGVVSGVLVVAGAADRAGIGAAAAGALVGALPNATVSIVVPPFGSHDVPTGVEPVRSLDLRDHLRAADIVVTAAGVTLLEALALGRPTVTFAMAANQERSAYGAAAAGAALAAAVDDIVATTMKLAVDPELRRRLAAAARLYIDGHGANRVAEAVVAL